MSNGYVVPRLQRFMVVLGIVLTALISASLFTACSRNERAADGVVAIPILLREGGNDAQTIMYRELVAMFEERYAGRYTLDVEWVPGMAQELRT
ncbi:MAG: hypothetical protein MI724_07585, partial [Spirochaetales bacterium]|nr:hypothetical protein [Spirochaetales bacterium]